MNKIRKETKGLFQCCWINHEDTAVDSGLEDDWKCIIQVNIELNLVLTTAPFKPQYERSCY